MKHINISTPAIAPDMGDSVWSRMIRDMAHAMNGVWASYRFTPNTSGNIIVNFYQVERLGRLVFINLSGVSTSGHTGSISLPVIAASNTALSSHQCKAYIMDNAISVEQITDTFIISGCYLAGG